MSLDPSGAHRWSHRFGDASGYQIAYGVAANASGDVAITGNFVNTANFGGGTLTSFGDDIFVRNSTPTVFTAGASTLDRVDTVRRRR